VLSDDRIGKMIELEPGRLKGLSKVAVEVVYSVLACIVARRSFCVVAGMAGGLSQCSAN